MKFFLRLLVAFAFPASMAAAIAQEAPMRIAVTVVDSLSGSYKASSRTELQGVITSLDKTKRLMTVVGGSGNEYVVSLGSDIKNRQKLKVGDLIVVNYINAIGLILRKDAAGIRERSESDGLVDKDKLGSNYQRARNVRVLADVTAIDLDKKTATLRGPKQTIDLVLSQPEMLKGIAVGDQVEILYRDATAVSVHRMN